MWGILDCCFDFGCGNVGVGNIYFEGEFVQFDWDECVGELARDLLF